MIKIAFCDDEKDMLLQIESLLDSYCADRDTQLEYTAYQSPLDLLEAADRGSVYDVIFLDMLMPGGNGIDVARELREKNESVKIIFLTVSPEFAVQSYTVGAFYYQLKPIEKDSFYELLDRVLSQCTQPPEDKLILKIKTGIASISLNQLVYCEVMNHTLYLHMRDGQVLASIGNLDNFSERLNSSGDFLRIHRSYLVNMAYIQHISGRSVIMSTGENLPLPHGKFNEVKTAFLEYSFEKEHVLL